MVRRIDELGRVVIPKEIRRTLRIKEGEEMTVSLLDEDTVVMKKFSPLKGYVDKAKDYRAIIERGIGRKVVVCDKDAVLSADVKSLVGKKPSKGIEEVIAGRKSERVFCNIVDGEDKAEYLVVPIVLNGDALGAIVVDATSKVDTRTEDYVDAIVQLILISIE